MSNSVDIHLDLENDAWVNEDGSLDRFAVKEALMRVVQIMTESSSRMMDVTSSMPIIDLNGNTSGKAILRFKADA